MTTFAIGFFTGLAVSALLIAGIWIFVDEEDEGNGGIRDTFHNDV